MQRHRIKADDGVGRAQDQDAFGIADSEPGCPQSRRARFKLEGRVVERYAPARPDAVRQTFRDLVGKSLEVEPAPRSA